MTLSKDKGSAENPTSGFLLLSLQQAKLRTLFPSFWRTHALILHFAVIYYEFRSSKKEARGPPPRLPRRQTERFWALRGREAGKGQIVTTRLTTLSKNKGSAENPTSGLLLLSLQQAKLRTLFPSFWRTHALILYFAFDVSLACRCAVPFGSNFGTQNGRKMDPKVLQNRSRMAFRRTHRPRPA